MGIRVNQCPLADEQKRREGVETLEEFQELLVDTVAWLGGFGMQQIDFIKDDQWTAALGREIHAQQAKGFWKIVDFSIAGHELQPEVGSSTQV